MRLQGLSCPSGWERAELPGCKGDRVVVMSGSSISGQTHRSLDRKPSTLHAFSTRLLSVMRRQRRLTLVFVLVSALGALGLVLPSPAATEPRGVRLTEKVDRTENAPGQLRFTFRTVKTEVYYRGGPVRLTSSLDGSGEIFTDDSMTLTVKKRNKGQPPLRIDFSQGCTTSKAEPPRDVTNLFRPGVNAVTLVLRDECGVAHSSLPYFLVGDIAFRNLKLEKQLGKGTNGGTFGDPVNTGIGNFQRQEVDLSFPDHVFGMTLSRTYNARDDEVGLLGQGWSTSFEASVFEDEEGTVSFRESNGRTLEFLPENSTYTRPEQFSGELRKEPDGTFRVEWYRGETWRFDTEGRLSGTRNWDGQEVQLSFEGDRLTAARGAHGYGITFAYDSNGRLTSAAASDGRHVTYQFGDAGVLVGVTDPTGATTAYSYDGDARLVRITDPEGRLTLSLSYDRDGRVVSQENASGGTATFAYDDAAGSTAITDESSAVVVFTHDPLGQLTGLTDPFSASTSRDYDTAGNLASVTRRNGATVRQTFDGHGNVTSREVGGATSRFSYDDQGRLLTTTDPTGGVTRYTYEDASRIPSTVVDPMGGVTRSVVEAGRVTAVTDPDGVTTTYTYDANGNLSSSTDGAKATTRFEHDAAGRRVATISPLGLVDRTSYDEVGRLVEATDPTGATTRYRYSPAGLPLEVVDPTGARTSSTYDGAGRLATEVDAVGAVTKYAYDSADNLTERTDPTGGVTSFTYDVLGRLLTETDATGAVIRHVYGPDGEELAASDALGNKTATTLDERGNVVTSTDAAQAVTRFSYDAADRLVLEVDPTGAERRLEYDAAGRVVAETDPLGATIRRRWTAAGRLSEVEDPLGRVTRYAYDEAGRLASVTDPGGEVTRYEYDLDGRQVGETSPAGLVKRLGYDGAGRRVTEASPWGGVTRTEYSRRGEPVAVTNPGGAVRRFEYDGAGRLITAVDANGGVTRYAYDLVGRLASLTDAKGATTRFASDSAGRETERSDPFGRTTRRSYDSEGRVTAVKLPTGETVEQTYDGVGRLLSRSAGGLVVRYGYDAAGRRVGMEDATGVTRYHYDAAGRLVGVTQPDGSTFATTYDAAGQATSLRYPSGREVTLGYDPAGHLIRLEERTSRGPASALDTLPRTISFRRPVDSLQRTTAVRLVALAEPPSTGAAFEVDADGRLLRQTLPGGWARSYEYQGGLLSSFAETSVTTKGPATRTTRLERDADGRIVAETTNGSTTRFAYDAAGQLVQVTGQPGGPLSFQYDATGNRTAAVKGGTTTRYRYDAAHQLLETQDGRTNTTYTYDEAGRRVRVAGPGGTRTTGYDPFGRIANQSTVEGARTQTRSLTYNGDDLLVGVRTVSQKGGGKPGAPVEHRFHWSVGADVPQVLTEVGPAGEADFVYGYNRTLALTPRMAAVFSSDVYGSVLQTHPTRSWAKASTYDVFGSPVGALGKSGADPSFGYRGELTIGDDLFLRARIYDPAVGRFTTRDPLDGVPGEVIAANPYPYADNDPVNKADPLGLRAKDEDFRFASGAALRPFQVPRVRGFGRVRIGFFIAEAEARLPLVPILGDGDGRGFDPRMGPKDNRIYIEIDFGNGRGFVQSNESCRDRAETNCTPALPIEGRFKSRVSSNSAVSIKFAIGNSRADAPVVGRLKISADLDVVPIRGGRGCVFGVVSRFPSSEAYYDLKTRTTTLFRNPQTKAGLFGLSFPDKGLPPCETTEVPPFAPSASRQAVSV